jgi:hypothetical protein
VQLLGAPAVSAKLDRIIVLLTPWLSVRGVALEGGQVVLNGPPALVLEQLKAWRERYRSGPGTAPATPRASLALRGEGLSLSWAGVDTTAAVQSITGISFERNADRQRAGFESAKLESRWGRVTAARAAAEFDPAAPGPVLRSASAGQVVGHVSIPMDVDTSAGIAPVSTTPGAAAAAPVSEPVAAARAPSPGAPSASAGRSPLLPAAAALGWVRGRERLAELRQLLARFMAPAAEIVLEQVQLEIARGESVLNVGPAPFRVWRDGDAVSASFTPPAEKDGKQLKVTGELPLTDRAIEISFEGGPISLQTLGVREGDFGLLGVDQSELTLATRIELSPEGALGISASGRLSHLAIAQPALAPEPLRDMDLTWEGQIHLDLENKKLAIDDGVLGFERVRVHLSGSLEASADDLRVEVSLQIPKTPCQDLLEAAPPALLPRLGGLRLGGNFSLDSRVELDTAAPKGTHVDWNMENLCKVLETPEAVDPKRFREPFQHFIPDAEGRASELTTGPTTEHWVPLADITPNMETALIVCEDSRFFGHNGFDNKAIRESILHNLRAGRFVRGASTLSMQLAKNLYLGREKTMSRKLQEAVFTLLLEERLSKEDILELYLNVVEFGPGIYGIRDAAKHYFNSHPGELSLAQALFFASVLRSPKANHFQEDGALRESWTEHLQYLMRIAHKIKRISDDELEAGLGERIVFGQAHANTESDFLFGTPLFELNDG